MSLPLLRPARTVLSAVAALLLAISLAGPVHAQASARVAAAEALFKEAVALARSSRYDQAIEKFQASYDLDPALGTLLGLAMAEQEAGRLATALGHYVLLGEEARRARDEDRTRIAERRMQELDARVPKLQLVAVGPLPSGALVSLDGEPLPAGALGSELPVDPGRHDVRVEAPGREPFVRSIELREGSREVIRLVLAPTPTLELGPTAPPPSPIPSAERSAWTPLRSAGAVTALLGVGVVGAGGVLFWKSGQTYDELERECIGGICPANRADDIEAGRQQETWGRIALVAGGVLAATGVTLVLVGGPRREQAAALQILPGGVRVRAQF